jgi:ribosomal protein L9
MSGNKNSASGPTPPDKGGRGSSGPPPPRFEIEFESIDAITIRESATGFRYVLPRKAALEKFEPENVRLALESSPKLDLVLTMRKTAEALTRVNPARRLAMLRYLGTFSEPDPVPTVEPADEQIQDWLPVTPPAEGVHERNRERERLHNLAVAERESAEKVAASLSQIHLVFNRHCDTEGRFIESVTASDIASALQECGFPVEPARISVPDTLIGDCVARIRLYHDVTAQVIMTVRPVATFSEADVWAVVVQQMKMLNSSVSEARARIAAIIEDDRSLRNVDGV